jgi:hypothetical protein
MIDVIHLAGLVVTVVSAALYLQRRFDKIDRKFDVIGAILIADCKTNPMVDEKRVEQALKRNGLRPEDFLKSK